MAPQALAGTTVAGQQHISTEMHFLNSSCGPVAGQHWNPSAEPAQPGPSVPVSVFLSLAQRTEAQHCCHFCSPLCLGGCRTCIVPSTWGERCGKCHPFTPAAKIPHLFPEEPSFPNFHGRQEQGNPVARAERPEQGCGDGRKPSCLSSCLFSSLLRRARGDVAFTSDSWGPGCPATR